MKWPWHRKSDDVDKLRAAEVELERVREQWPKVRAESAEVADHGRRNHIAEKISLIYRGER